jgi:Protein of unknown function (DUF3644)
MTAKKRVRRVFSVSDELIGKSRESALAAVQIFNNPLITFKSEMFIVMINIAWTYLLHSYYRKNKIEYRYFEKIGKVRRFDRTKNGAYKYWELERCLNEKTCPIESDTSNNLRFLIGIRHEIEHQMTTSIDSSFSAKFQACCLNYNEYIKKFFGDDQGIDHYLSFSLQFSSISKDQMEQLRHQSKLPPNIQGYVQNFESALSDKEFNSPKFAYRVLFVPKTANRKGQADEVIEFVKPDSDVSKSANLTYALIKETERPKFLPSKIVELMKKNGFNKFKQNNHTNLWKEKDAKDPAKGFGVQVESTWYWYENWVDQVTSYCSANPKLFI